MIKYIPEMLGDKDWQPDLLYFNTGSWDAFLQQRGDRNWTEPDRLYGVLMDYIVSTCDPARQVRRVGLNECDFGRPVDR